MKKKQKQQTKITVQKDTDEVDVEGIVVEALPNAMFRVKLANDAVILCTISGKIRIHNVRILPDDKVIVGVKIYDVSKGRIKYRCKDAR